MGKKGKIGKQRKDKYYQLAKEIGYRSRAAFKLIQLNQKFEFLQKAKVLIDLCAAPGGWLQVAQKHMPVSSVIIGVDLVSIKPIHNVITLQEDITTQKCRSSLKKNLKTWKADVVLHDGAPNVGKSWIHDAFEQNLLTLSALHLACDFLIKGGWFVTKVFRSKDYNALIWVLNKLFRKVFATKPQASRNESAEIFIVCQNFLAPDKIDPKFFDPTHVFADLKEKEQKITTNNLINFNVKMKKAKAVGYENDETILYHKVNASEYIESANYAEILSKASEIVLDTEFIKNHPSTTNEIVACIQDIKILGRKELTLLINWRKNLRNEFKKIKHEKDKGNPKESELSKNDDDDDDDDNDDKVEEIDSFEDEEALKLKRKRKKIAKEKRKLAERMNLKMMLKNDQLVQEEQDLFDLSKIKKNLDKLKDVDPYVLCDDNDDDQENEKRTNRKIFYDKDSNKRYLDSDESEVSENSDYEENYEKPNDSNNESDLESFNERDKNELLVDLENTKDRTTRMREMFFDNPIFKKFSSNEDEFIEMQEIKNFFFKSKNMENELTLKNNPLTNSNESEFQTNTIGNLNESKELINGNEQSNHFPEKILSHEELAMASIMIKSKKAKRDLSDDGWNRYMHEDSDGAPSWFRKEEEIHCRKSMSALEEYSKKYKEINSRPIKKVLEAKARKKKRVLRRLEKARIKAESLTEDPSMSNKEKADCIRRIYKKASLKNKQPKLVVAKKQYGNRRPPGVKGRYKIVDPRMKKDKRKLQNNKKLTKNRNNNKSKNMRKKL